MKLNYGKDTKEILDPDIGKFIYTAEERTTEALILEINCNWPAPLREDLRISFPCTNCLKLSMWELLFTALISH